MPAVTTLLLLPLFISLGAWQLERAGQKQRLHEDFMQRQAGPVMTLTGRDVVFNESADQWLPVRVRGAFLEEYQVLLDNRTVNGRVGYYVFTPFLIEGNDTPVLVNRGWIAANADRSAAPVLRMTSGEVEIEGILKKPVSTGISLGEYPPESLTRRFFRVQDIDLAELSAVLEMRLQPLILRLDQRSPGGYARDWALPGSGEAKHLGYAFQWFAFAAVLLILFVALNIKKIEPENESRNQE